MIEEWYFRIWGKAKFYVGKERWSAETRGKRLSMAWMTELEAPYRIGNAVRLRIRHHAYHLGRYKRAPKPPGRELPDVSLDDIKGYVPSTVSTDIFDLDRLELNLYNQGKEPDAPSEEDDEDWSY